METHPPGSLDIKARARYSSDDKIVLQPEIWGRERRACGMPAGTVRPRPSPWGLTRSWALCRCYSVDYSTVRLFLSQLYTGILVTLETQWARTAA